MSTVKRVPVGNYTIAANSVIHNTLANVVTSTSNYTLDLNSSLSAFVPSPISTSGTATLGNGSPGQTMTISSFSSSTWTVRVNSAAWRSYSGSPTSGNLIFNTENSSVTLRWTPELYGWHIISTEASVVITT